MNALSPIAAYLDRAASRLALGTDLVRAMLRTPTSVDPAIALPTLSAAALLDRHPHHPAHARAAALLSDPAIPALLDRALTPADIAEYPVITASMAHEDKIAALHETVELGALWSWTAAPLRDAITDHLDDQADTFTADHNQHADLLEPVSLLAEIARFDPIDHPLGMFLATAHTFSLGLYPTLSSDDIDTVMQRAIDATTPTRSWSDRLIDRIEASLAMLGNIVAIPRPRADFAYASDVDDVPPPRTQLNPGSTFDEEINLVVRKTDVCIEWQGPAADPPTRLLFGDTPVTAAPVAKPLGTELRLTWSLRNTILPAEKTSLVIEFSSGRTFQLPL